LIEGRKIECIQSSTIKQTKKNKCFHSSVIDDLTLLTKTSIFFFNRPCFLPVHLDNRFGSNF